MSVLLAKLFFIILLCVVLMYWLIVSKLLSPTGNAFLDWLRKDTYYCVLGTLTIPVSIVVLYLSWFTNQLFRRN